MVKKEGKKKKKMQSAWEAEIKLSAIKWNKKVASLVHEDL